MAVPDPYPTADWSYVTFRRAHPNQINDRTALSTRRRPALETLGRPSSPSPARTSPTTPGGRWAASGNSRDQGREGGRRGKQPWIFTAAA